MKPRSLVRLSAVTLVGSYKSVLDSRQQMISAKKTTASGLGEVNKYKERIETTEEHQSYACRAGGHHVLCSITAPKALDRRQERKGVGAWSLDFVFSRL